MLEMQTQTNLPTLAPPVLDGEVLPPSACDVRVVARRDPLSLDRRILHFRPGETIAQIMETVQPRPYFRRLCRVWLGDELIPAANWHRTRPKPGTNLTVVAVPQGGGSSKVLRFVLLLAVAAASIATAGALTPIIGAVGAGLIAAGTGIAGPLRLLRLEDML
jgi:hypothetical protein